MKLPVLSGKELVKLLVKAGYTVHNQKGSHVHLRHATRPPLTVPMHNEIARGTLKAIMDAAGLKREDLS